MQLQARDKRALMLGAALVTLLLAYLMWPRSAPRETGVELVAADKRPGGAAPAPVGAPVQPMQTVTAPAVPVQAVAPATPIPEGLRLTGVTGRGAIFAYADGTQRLVARGRDVAPGVMLQAVRLRDVILAVGPTNYRLGFGGAALPIQPPGTVTAVAAPPAPAAPPPPAVLPGVPTNPRPAPGATPTVVMPAPAPNANPAR
jgi:hypothetical protein